MNDITSVRSACCQYTGTGGPPARTARQHRRGVEGRRYVWEVAAQMTEIRGRDPPEEPDR